MLRLILVLLLNFAISPTLGVTTRSPTLICDQWCSSKFPASAARRACIRDAKNWKGVCYTCGPKAGTTTKTLCGNSCVDLKKDRNNCGACRNVCSGGMICSAGTCVCPAGMTSCNGVCKNLSKDKNNCGYCDVGCYGEALCTGGYCACPGGKTLCGEKCLDTMANDPNNCGCVKVVLALGVNVSVPLAAVSARTNASTLTPTTNTAGDTGTHVLSAPLAFQANALVLLANPFARAFGAPPWRTTTLLVGNAVTCVWVELFALDAAASVSTTESSAMAGVPLLIMTERTAETVASSARIMAGAAEASANVALAKQYAANRVEALTMMTTTVEPVVEYAQMTDDALRAFVTAMYVPKVG
ncbi:hypothetical protein BHE90_000013 [Fusarium euwallaceae]|uniref:TNFR-Cys domain-containing protein n=1 Tax=Fusarium euwallaceae TaxID=1147111 RepID=A0A430MBD0_9HYPO|nr:hypothetical protein BHE90_000013 [Fusarium euwallaceae]